MKMDAGYDKMNIIFRIFCVYDEPSADKKFLKGTAHISSLIVIKMKRGYKNGCFGNSS